MAEPRFRPSALQACVCTFLPWQKAAAAMLSVSFLCWWWSWHYGSGKCCLSGTGALGSLGSARRSSINLTRGQFAHQKRSKLRSEV